MKQCKICNIIKELNCFETYNKTKIRNQCKDCRKKSAQPANEERKQRKLKLLESYKLNGYNKKCSKCLEIKDFNEFIFRDGCEDGLRNECKSCMSISHKKYFLKNHEKFLKDRKEYVENNKEKVKISKTKDYQKNKEKYNEYKRKFLIKKREDPIFRLSLNISRGIHHSLKEGNKKGGRHWESLVNYTLSELKIHLENLFKEDMSWENYGKNGWHIDHVTPKSLFNIKACGDEEFKKCWALSNLQPLWERENLSKGNRVKK